MATPTNNYKLGIFVLVGFVVTVAVAVVLGALGTRKETVVYYTYYNESVQGLDLGAPVKFRGVTIGHVSDIEIAPDHRQVEVANELDVKDIGRMGLSIAGIGKTHFSVPEDLRAQLGSQGITGVKFVSIDFFDPKTHPAPSLPFPTPENYIPAAPSLVKNLEDSVGKSLDRVPDLLDTAIVVLVRIDRILGSYEDAGVTDSAAATIRQANEVLTELRGLVKHLDRSNLGDKAAATLQDAQAAVGKMNALLDKLDGDEGLFAAAKRAADSASELGSDARGTTRELESTLRDVGEAARAIRSIAKSLDRDPEMFVKGRDTGRDTAKGKSP